MSEEKHPCPACGETCLSKVDMPIRQFSICSNCYCTQLPWSQLQAVKRELFFNSRKKWADALAKAPSVILNPKCSIHGSDLELKNIREYGSIKAWQEQDENCELMVIEPSVMVEILNGSTQVRETFKASKYQARNKWNPLAFIGKLFADKKDDDLDDLFEDIQFERKIAPCLGLES